MMLAAGGFNTSEIGGVLLGWEATATTITMTFHTNVDCSPIIYWKEATDENMTEVVLACDEQVHEHTIGSLTPDTVHLVRIYMAVGGLTTEYLPGGLTGVYQIRTGTSGSDCGEMLLPTEEMA